jgi:hypothetical protein
MFAFKNARFAEQVVSRASFMSRRQSISRQGTAESTRPRVSVLPLMVQGHQAVPARFATIKEGASRNRGVFGLLAAHLPTQNMGGDMEQNRKREPDYPVG